MNVALPAKRRGVMIKLNEAHVIFSCPAVSVQRLGLGLSTFKAAAMGKGLNMCHEVRHAFVNIYIHLL